MRRYTNAEMLDELRRVAAQVDGPLSRPKYQPVGRISAPAITVRFGKWSAAIAEAGLPPAYRYGGIWFACPICGTSFRSDNSSKSRRTCSRECASKKKSVSKTKPMIRRRGSMRTTRTATPTTTHRKTLRGCAARVICSTTLGDGPVDFGPREQAESWMSPRRRLIARPSSPKADLSDDDKIAKVDIILRELRELCRKENQG